MELKVYGHIYPANSILERELSEALESAICDDISHDIPLLEREKDMLRISFEGRYFPEEDVIDVLKRHLKHEHRGKLDILDMDDWRMRRYLFDGGELVRKEASLNQVMDYSGF